MKKIIKTILYILCVAAFVACVILSLHPVYKSQLWLIAAFPLTGLGTAIGTMALVVDTMTYAEMRMELARRKENN